MTVKEYLELSKKYPDSTRYEGWEKDFELIQNYNKQLISEYPFLLPKNRWTGNVVDDYDYSFTEMDAMPEGWRIAFGDDMLKEIKDTILKEGPDSLEKFTITEIKEKFGGLRFYCFYTSEEVYRVIGKYESMSYNICIDCGKPAKWISKGWIAPFCEECKNKDKDYCEAYELIEEE